MTIEDLIKKLEKIDGKNSKIYIRGENDEVKEISELSIQFALTEGESDLLIIG